MQQIVKVLRRIGGLRALGAKKRPDEARSRSNTGSCWSSSARRTDRPQSNGRSAIRRQMRTRPERRGSSSTKWIRRPTRRARPPSTTRPQTRVPRHPTDGGVCAVDYAQRQIDNNLGLNIEGGVLDYALWQATLQQHPRVQSALAQATLSRPSAPPKPSLKPRTSVYEKNIGKTTRSTTPRTSTTTCASAAFPAESL